MRIKDKQTQREQETTTAQQARELFARWAAEEEAGYEGGVSWEELTSTASFEEWLRRSLSGARRPKDYHAPAISEYHAELLDRDQRILKRLGYSRRQCSLGNLIELAIELQHEQL